MVTGGAAALCRPKLQGLRLLKYRCNRCNLSTDATHFDREIIKNRRTSSPEGKGSASKRPSSARNNAKTDRLHADQARRSTPNRQDRPQAKPGPIINPNARHHYQLDGRFKTSAENYEWIRKTGIVPDNNDKWYMQGLDKSKKKHLALTATFSRKYYVDPIHTPYFAPHLEPRVVALRAEYERKLSKPLWVYAGCFTDDRVVVRTMAKRKLVGYMHKAHQTLLKEGLHVRGTVHFSIFSTFKVLELAKDELLKILTDALRHEASQQIQPLKAERPDVDGKTMPVTTDATPAAESIQDVFKPTAQEKPARDQHEAASRQKSVRSAGKAKSAGNRFQAQKEIGSRQAPESQEEQPEIRAKDKILNAEQNRQRSKADLWTDEAKAASASGRARIASTKAKETLNFKGARQSRQVEGIDS